MTQPRKPKIGPVLLALAAGGILAALAFMLTYTDHEDQVRSAVRDLRIGMSKTDVQERLRQRGISLSNRQTAFDGDPRHRTRRCGLITGFTYCSSGVFFFDEEQRLQGVSIESWKWDHDMPVEFLLRRAEG